MTEEKKQAILALFESITDGGGRNGEAQNKLARLLQGDPEAQAFYVEQCQIHSMLAFEHGSLPSRESLLPANDVRGFSIADANRNRRHWRRLAIAASVLFVLSSCFAVYFANRPRQQIADAGSVGETPVDFEDTESPSVPWENRSDVAKLHKSIAASLRTSDDSIDLAVGDHLRTGSYRLTTGLVELKFPSDVKVLIEAPASFQLISSMKMIVHQGALTANVPEQGKGFQVITPDGDLVDYGTEFAVEVFPDQGTEYHVFKGEVKVAPRNVLPKNQELTLLAGQAASIHAESGIPEGIDIARNRYMRQVNLSDAADSQHGQLVRSLSPKIWLSMSPNAEEMLLSDDGTDHNSAKLLTSPRQASAFKPGKFDAAIFFPGPAARSYAMVSDYKPIQGGVMTVCAWVFAESRPRWGSIVKHWSIELDDNSLPVGSGQFHFGLHEDSGELELQVLDRECRRIKLRDDIVFPIGVWQHVAFVVDGQEVRLYRNAVEVDAQPCQGLMAGGPSVMGIGAKLRQDGSGPDANNPGYWHGRIDELAIFEKPLNPEQITALLECSPSAGE